MRGSIALEFLLVVLAIAVYIGFTVKAMEVVGLQSAEDISKMVRTRTAMNKIYNAVQFLAAGGDGSSTVIYVYVPADVNITLQNSEIRAVVPTEGNFAHLPNCTATECTFSIATQLPFDSSRTLSKGITNIVVLTRQGGKVVPS